MLTFTFIKKKTKQNTQKRGTIANLTKADSKFLNINVEFESKIKRLIYKR